MFTDQSQTHQNAVNEHFPPSGLHLPAPVVLAQRAGDAGGGWQSRGEAGHWGGKAARVGIRFSFCLLRLNEIDLLSSFPPFCHVFLKMHQRTAEPYHPNLHFCNLHELIGAWRQLTVVCAHMHACSCVFVCVCLGLCFLI